MVTINANELIAAGIKFNILNDDTAFNNPAADSEDWQDFVKHDGELLGYSEVGAGHFGDDRVVTEHTPLCDTTSLSDDFPAVAQTDIVEIFEGDDDYIDDDGDEATRDKQWHREQDLVNGRWAHVKDADFAEKLSKLNLYHRLDVVNRPWGEMQEVTKWRKARWSRQMEFVGNCYDAKLLRDLQQEAWKRYLASVTRAVITKQWWSLYLTKFEIRDLSDTISAKRKAIFAGLRAPKKAKTANVVPEGPTQAACLRASGIHESKAPMTEKLEWGDASQVMHHFA